MQDTSTPSKACAVRRKTRPASDWARGLALGLLAFAGAAAADLPLPELGHSLTRLEKPIRAPGFRIRDMDGKLHALGDYRGYVVMLNFWATWCPPCRREMPSMEALFNRFQKESFVVLAVNEWEQPDLVFAYLGQINVTPTFPILHDTDGKVAELYGVKGLPTTVLIDRHGRIVYRAVGGRDYDHPAVEKIIRGLLK